jgi:hypothetical protein
MTTVPNAPPAPRRASPTALALALAACLAGAYAPTPARAAGLVDSAIQAVSAMERATGVPIVILERTGDDPGQFWYLASQALCAKTGDNWCEEDLQVLSDTTNLLGWSRVLNYTPKTGQQGGVTVGAGAKSVCVILPPKPGVSAGFVAIGLSGGGSYSYAELPTDDEAEAYLYLIHAAGCAASGGDAAADQKRADAFASLTLTLLEGNGSFVSGAAVSPARKFATFRNQEAVRWSVSVGERTLLDLWKGQAAGILRSQYGCNANVVDSADIDTQSIQRTSLPRGGDCTSRNGGQPQGSVEDGNLWAWTSGGAAGTPAVAMPPQAYSPFMGFPSVDDGVRYAWTTSASIAQQR